MLFQSYHIRRSDRRRVRLPAEILRSLPSRRLVIAKGFWGSLDLYTEAGWAGFVDQLLGRFALDLETRRLRRFFTSAAVEVDLDTRGAFSLPPRLTDYAELEDRVSLLFIGNRAHVISTTRWKELLGQVASSPGPTFTVDLAGDPFVLPSMRESTWETVEPLGRMQLDGEAHLARGRGRRLEYEVAEILGRSGVGVIELTRESGDNGIDLIIHIPSADRNELVYVQCKSGGQCATVREARELMGVIARDGVSAGLLVATSGFTPSACQEAAVSKVRIDLADLERLGGWIDSRHSEMIAAAANKGIERTASALD